jgi:hypothetical protein
MHTLILCLIEKPLDWWWCARDLTQIFEVKVTSSPCKNFTNLCFLKECPRSKFPLGPPLPLESKFSNCIVELWCAHCTMNFADSRLLHNICSVELSCATISLFPPFLSVSNSDWSVELSMGPMKQFDTNIYLRIRHVMHCARTIVAK